MGRIRDANRTAENQANGYGTAPSNGHPPRLQRGDGIKLVTGATGTLGRSLIAEILSHSGCRIVTVVRARGDESPRDRLRRLLGDSISEIDFDARITVVDGDLATPVDLRERIGEPVIAEIDEVFHLAASTDLGGRRNDLMQANRDGTARILELAEAIHQTGGLRRFCYFSTAFVAGSGQNWLAPEDAMCSHPAWANAYEESKYSAELLVRGAMERGVPAIIFRPSIVVGDSDSGETNEFGLFYSIVRRFVRCSLPVFPGAPTDRLQIVPIDFVVRAAWAISADPANLGRTYHLTSGNAPELKTLIEVVSDEVPGVPDVRLVPPERFDIGDLRPSRRAIMQGMMPYLGYLHRDLRFETTNTEAALAGTGIAMPDTGSHFVRLITSHARRAGYFNGAAPEKEVSGRPSKRPAVARVAPERRELVHAGNQGNASGIVQP